MKQERAQVAGAVTKNWRELVEPLDQAALMELGSAHEHRFDHRNSHSHPNAARADPSSRNFLLPTEAVAPRRFGV
jgi:hypothetical protein